MTIKEIYAEIMGHKVESLMFHQQAEKMMNFLGFKGLKKWQCYQNIKESVELSKINNYIICHHNIIINEKDPKNISIIPNSWYNYTRFEVDNSTRQTALKDFFGNWQNREKEVKESLSLMYKEVHELGLIADLIEIKKMILDVDKELKCIDRKFLEYKSTDFSLEYIMSDQCYLHEKYAKKAKEMIGD